MIRTELKGLKTDSTVNIFGYYKSRELLDHLSNYQLLEKTFAM
jgi:hypothetical protein